MVSDPSMERAVLSYESTWLAQFWPPIAVHDDDAFNKDVFNNYLKHFDTLFHPVTPRRHFKIPIESKHRIIRSIDLRLKDASSSNDPSHS